MSKSSIPNIPTCTSEAISVPGLLFRRPAGLKRPTHEHPSLGTVEKVFNDGMRFWQGQRHLAGNRITRIDRLVDDWNEENIKDAMEFLSMLQKEERRLRENVIQQRFAATSDGANATPSLDEIIKNLDEWMAPWEIDRESDGEWSMNCDCLDAPGGKLLGCYRIRVMVDNKQNITRVQPETDLYSFDDQPSFIQRIIPANCGYVADSVADQFIASRPVKMTLPLLELLRRSFDETQALRETASLSVQPFLKEAVRLLGLQLERSQR